MRNDRLVLFLAALLCACANRGVAATIDVDTVLGPGHPYPDQTIAVVDGANPPTRVTILEGAQIGDAIGGETVAVGIDAFGQSEIRMVGGAVAGSQRGVRLHDRSDFHLLDGFVSGIEARDESRVNITGGHWEYLRSFESSRVFINHPSFDDNISIHTFDDSVTRLSGGYFAYGRASGRSRFVMTGDRSTGMSSLEGLEESRIVIHDGILNQGGLVIGGNSQAYVDGGSLEDLDAFGESVLIWRGGRVAQESIFTVSGFAQSHIYGMGLQYFVDEFEGPMIVGQWADGTRMAVRYQIQDQGQIILHEVPEPAAWALLAIGAAGLVCFRRR